ncbi:hypothetical protein, partial [Acinetobacter proteolyticus]
NLCFLLFKSYIYFNVFLLNMRNMSHIINNNAYSFFTNLLGFISIRGSFLAPKLKMLIGIFRPSITAVII